jgi:hypothetical protein
MSSAEHCHVRGWLAGRRESFRTSRYPDEPLDMKGLSAQRRIVQGLASIYRDETANVC